MVMKRNDAVFIKIYLDFRFDFFENEWRDYGL